MKKIAVLTSGGDAPGMNGAIRAIVRVGIKRGFEVYGVYGGFHGLVEGKIKKLGYSDVSEILAKGGTILESSRLPEFKLEEVQDKAIDNLKGYDIDSLIVIGGDGSYRGALSLSKKGINCIGIPGTIDNDINGTDETIGFHTALSNIIDAVNKLRDTSSSHHRCFVIEVMGNNADSLALYSAISCGSELVITHKTGFDEDFVIAEMIKNETVYNKRHAIIIVSEKILDVDNLAKRISEETGFSGRAIVLGHIQRGGSPVPEDRILASRMAGKAIELLINNESGKCVCLKNSEIVAMGIEEALKETNQSKELLYQLFEDLV
ncbi:6-phosphofructokinase [Thomasclavelia cocleata]|uniref:ATP-dependent 6-phosphofructokinase n=1 Tax=Thomasclavelia cocleata TaxID=69824 RepID=A0A1I0D012_9FIRM|nr:6-phosphofructokinase [Thomasclavelia cocleata]MCR1959734.1 6-phosphofructokinase [Thomasclavelia cocleata]NDO41078.1 6-phosphofructokinase [Thomasclavelia cocleata]PJN81605.1 6-phosphofructokinase [Thomasclavelia cocleata]SET25468.1 6-phosphofructokinase [Thomasclavelia cocleata]